MTESITQHIYESAPCHVCGAAALAAVPGYEAFRRVTSDCRPWPANGRLCVCAACGIVQKPVDAGWRDEAAAIYSNYEVYHQSGGVEQAVFSPRGAAAARSVRVAEAMRANAAPPARGRLLDIGCGNGALLRAFHADAPDWALAGLELDGRNRAAIESVPGVQALFTGGPADAPGTFDAITMIHALEHIPDPQQYLESIKQKLNPGGILVLEQPHFIENPFDLLIADHCSHFSGETLTNLLNAAGFETTYLATDWIPREITAIARRTGYITEIEPADSAISLKAAAACLKWLGAARAAARAAAGAGSLGVFGTSIAATWLFAELGGRAAFFVDEDSARAGREFMGRPVFAPAGAPAGSRVFTPVPPSMAGNIVSRLKIAGLTPVLPPVFNVNPV
jgi:SAM-dependent methyltransferase